MAHESKFGKKLPRYAAVASVLEEDVLALGPNTLLPTEQQLSRRFGVSRVTVRSALDLLERSGLVSRKRGRGTIVSPHKITRRFAPLFSFEQDLGSQGIPFETRVLSYEADMTPPEDIRQLLKLSKKEVVGCLSLLRLVHEQVVCHDCRYYPAEIAHNLRPHRVETETALEVLEQLVGSPIEESVWESQIISAPPDVAKALGIPQRTLVLSNTYAWYIKGHVPVEAGVISYRVDRCKFRYEAKILHRSEEEVAVLSPD